MTREEAKNWLNKLYARADITDEYGDMEDMQPYEEAVNMAINALEQEPKTGHWIEIAQYSDGKHKIECSECGNLIFDRGHANSFNVNNKYKYCPNCGAKMEVSE